MDYLWRRPFRMKVAVRSGSNLCWPGLLERQFISPKWPCEACYKHSMSKSSTMQDIRHRHKNLYIILRKFRGDFVGCHSNQTFWLFWRTFESSHSQMKLWWHKPGHPTWPKHLKNGPNTPFCSSRGPASCYIANQLPYSCYLILQKVFRAQFFWPIQAASVFG